MFRRLAFLFLLPAVVCAQDPCASIYNAKESTYGFHPTELDDKGRDAKSTQMDAFWELVEKEKESGSLCLANLLQKEQQDGFFLFDGASLLFNLDSSEKHWPVVVASIQRSDLSQIDPAGYVGLLVRLGKAGVDTGALARRYLEMEKAEAFVPLHALKLERWMGALFIYASMSAEASSRYLTEALQSASPDARGIAAVLLSFNMNEEGFRTLYGFAELDQLPEAHLTQVKAMQKREPYLPPASPPRFAREQVLEFLRLIPHSREELDQAFERRQEWEKLHPELNIPDHAKDKEALEAMHRKTEESPPFTSLEGHTRFIESAIATLTEADLPAVRDARRKAIRVSDEAIYEYFAYTRILRGVVNRLDLYKEYRSY